MEIFFLLIRKNSTYKKIKDIAFNNKVKCRLNKSSTNVCLFKSEKLGTKMSLRVKCFLRNSVDISKRHNMHTNKNRLYNWFCHFYYKLSSSNGIFLIQT